MTLTNLLIPVSDKSTETKSVYILSTKIFFCLRKILVPFSKIQVLFNKIQVYSITLKYSLHIQVYSSYFKYCWAELQRPLS